MGFLRKTTSISLVAVSLLSQVLHASPSIASDIDLPTKHQLHPRDVLPPCRLLIKTDIWATCLSFLDRFAVEYYDFLALNPQLLEDCSNFVPGNSYCARRETTMPKTTDGICGSVVGKSCTDSGFGNCCGPSGVCGSTPNECGTGGCQYPYGTCDPTPDPTTTSTPVSSPTPLPDPYSPSPDGTCGYANKYVCSGTAWHFGSCCSSSGHCGTSEWHCYDILGCQPEFGLCDTVSLATGATVTQSSSSSSTQTTIPTSTGVPPKGYVRVGCYTDIPAARTLGTSFSAAVGPSVMTMSKCLRACQVAGFHFAGVEYAQECHCGNSLGGTGVIAAGTTNCNMACRGDNSESCGGDAAIEIYTVPIWEYIGCQSSSQSSHSLPEQVIIDQAAIMTVELCQSACQERKYLYAGLEYGHQCWCGNTTKGTVAPAVQCSMPCSGNSAQTCGNGDRQNLYRQVRTWAEMGCYSDSANSRRLEHRALLDSAASMTREKCQVACSTAGYTIAGLVNGRDCWCDSSINGGELLQYSSCNVACTGNSAQICGGTEQIDLWISA